MLAQSSLDRPSFQTGSGIKEALVSDSHFSHTGICWKLHLLPTVQPLWEQLRTKPHLKESRHESYKFKGCSCHRTNFVAYYTVLLFVYIFPRGSEKMCKNIMASCSLMRLWPFSGPAPDTWNCLSPISHNADLLSIFKSLLKMRVFREAFGNATTISLKTFTA